MAQLFGVDLRSLAAMRIAIAIVLLYDLGLRLGDLGAHYTDAGLVTRVGVLEAFDFLHEWPLCLHLATGSWGGQLLLFALHGAVLVCLMLGYHTRLATLLAWVLTTSLQLRNLYVGHGADAYIRMILLWGVFLPLGARASVDAYRRRGDGAAGPLHGVAGGTQQMLSAGSVALLVQIAIIYLTTGYAKLMVPEWRDGTAVAMGFDNELWGTYTGNLLLQAPWLCAMLAHGVLVFELLTPLLLFFPFGMGPLRTGLIAGLSLMHIGFGMGLRIGIFSITSISALFGLLPGWFWEKVGQSRAGTTMYRWCDGVMNGFFGAASIDPPSPRLSAYPVRWLASQALCTVMVAYLVFWNIGVSSNRNFEAPAGISWFGSMFFMQQDWRMFGEPVRRTGWISIPGKLADGTNVDLALAGGPLPSLEAARAPEGWGLERPERTIYRVINDRWLVVLDRIIHRKRGEDLPRAYGRYLCRSWNATHSGDEQLQRFELLFLHRPTKPFPHAYSTRDYEVDQVWVHGCFS